jgi:hypothetical protein
MKALGVGRIAFTAPIRFVPCPRSNTAFELLLLPPVEIVGVGHNPDPLSKVGRSDIGSSQDSPSRRIPHRGQVSENHSESPRSEYWRVFHKRISGAYFTDDSCHFHPESAFVSFDSSSFPCCTDVLTGKSARYHVDKSPPRLPVKGANVIPNRERGEKSVILPLHKYACGVGLAFNCAHGRPSKDLASKYAATSARE